MENNLKELKITYTINNRFSYIKQTEVKINDSENARRKILDQFFIWDTFGNKKDFISGKTNLINFSLEEGDHVKLAKIEIMECN